MKTLIEILNPQGKVVEVVDITNYGICARAMSKEIVKNHLKPNHSMREVTKKGKAAPREVAQVQPQKQNIGFRTQS